MNDIPRIALRFLLLLIIFPMISLSYAAENILIIEPRTGFDGEQIKVELQKILEGTGASDVNVEVTGPTETDQTFLSGWYHDPSHDAEKRWSDLRGKNGTTWDYVIIMENPKVIETFPGWYAQGVHDIAKEVERGKGEAVILMQWPTVGSKATLNYYKEVSYRVGRGRDLKVVPAGLAFDAAGNPDNAQDAAYIAAASIYSRLWNANAKSSSYSYNDTLAQTAFETVIANKDKVQYYGQFTSAPNGIHKMSGNQNRIIRIINDAYITRGFPLETIVNSNTWNLTTNMGLINRITKKEYRGAASGLERMGTPNDNADLHYIASTSARATTASLYISKLYNYVYNKNARSLAEGLKYDYNHEAPSLANAWAKNRALRQLPFKLLLSQAFRHYQSYDKDVIDIHTASKKIYASYMITMLTGRCPMVLKDAGTQDYILQQMGYESAWRFSTLHGRAPGFKTWPSDALRMTVDPRHGETMKVAFALPPKSDVTVSIRTSNPIATVSQQPLIFTPENYNVPQSLVINVTKDAKPLTPFEVIYKTSSDDIVCNELRESWTYRVNSSPLADSQDLSVKSDQPSPIYLSGSDPDDLSNNSTLQPPPPSTELLKYFILTPPKNGTVVINGSTAAYTPNPGFTGKDSFTFRAKDFSVFSTAATVNITVESDGGIYEKNLLINGSAELTPLKNYSWLELQGNWGTASTTDGLSAFKCLKSPKSSKTGELYQDIELSPYIKAINNGSQTFTISGLVGSGKGDQASVVAMFFDAENQALSTYDTGTLPLKPTTFSQQFLAPVGCTRIRVLLRAINTRGGVACSFDEIKLIAFDPIAKKKQ